MKRKICTALLGAAITVSAAGQQLSAAIDWVAASGTNGGDGGRATIIDNANSFVYETGVFSNNITFTTTSGNVNFASLGGLDIYVCRYDLSGNRLAVMRLGTVGNDEANAIMRLGTQIYLGGYFNGNGSTESILLYNISGAFVNGSSVAIPTVGGTNTPGAGRIRGLTTNGTDVFAAGTFRTGTASFWQGGASFLNLTTTQVLSSFVSRSTAQTANPMTYITAIQPTTQSGSNEATAIICGPFNNATRLYTCGYFMGNLRFTGSSTTLIPSGTRDIYLTAVDISGTGLAYVMNDQRQAGSPFAEGTPSTTLGDIPWGIASNDNNNLYITGQLSATSAGNAVFDAQSASGLTPIRSMFVARYTVAGTIQPCSWVTTISDAQLSTGFAVASGNYASRELFVTGQAYGNAIVRGTSGTQQQFNISSTTSCGYLARLNNDNGQLVWADRLASMTCNSNAAAAYSISYTKNCKLAVTGSYNGTTRIGNRASNTALGGSDSFVFFADFDLLTTRNLTANLSAGTVNVPLSASSLISTSYNWAGTGLTSTTGSSTSANLAAVGTYNYTVTATNTGGTCPMTETITVTVTNNANGPAGADVQTCCSSAAIQIGGAAQLGWSYLWTAPAGASVTPVNNTPTMATGLGTFTLTVTDPCGNVTIDQVTVTASGGPNCCRIGQFGNTSNTSAFNLFPNPGSGMLNIESKNENEKVLIITDVTGRNVHREVFSSKTLRVDLSQEPNGTYFIEIVDNGTVEVKQWIKQ